MHAYCCSPLVFLWGLGPPILIHAYVPMGIRSPWGLGPLITSFAFLRNTMGLRFPINLSIYSRFMLNAHAQILCI